MKKAISISLLLFVLLPGSAFHDMLILTLVLSMWRREIKKTLQKYDFRGLWCVMALLTLALMPMPVVFGNRHVELVHFDGEGERLSAPLHHWVANLILPEETMCAAGCFGALFPLETFFERVGFRGRENNSIIQNYREDALSGRMSCVGRCYRKTTSVMSGIHTQFFNSFLGEDIRSAYIVKPKNFDRKKEYPVLFFAHGYLGNWKLYPGLLDGIEDHIIVCIGTEDISGIFGSRHIGEIKSLYLPMLADIGYRVDPSAVSLMGLSNGGSAVDAAYASCCDEFKNLIYVSTGVNHTERTNAKVMIAGGGKDHCASSMKRGMARLKSNHQKSAFCFDEEHTHLKLITDVDNITEFLNQEL